MRRLVLVLAAAAMAACSSSVSPTHPSAVETRGPMASKYADTTFVASRASVQFQVTDRNSNGLATAFSSFKQVLAPALYKYTTGPYEIKDPPAGSGKQWELVIMDATAVIAPQAGNDPDVQIIPNKNPDDALTGQKLNAINAWLATTDFGVTATSGQSVRQVLEAILIAMGHSPDAAGQL
jgi:hypothetical protein